MHLLLVCGFRRTGKDALVQKLNNTLDGAFDWQVYQPRGSNIQMPHNVVRRGFADLLKQEVADIYNIPAVISDDDKDSKVYTHYQTGEIVSARDIYIEWGTFRRAQDPNYWCGKVLEHLTPEITTVVTDWRFQNEIVYAQNNIQRILFGNNGEQSNCRAVCTLRVYRSEIPEPDMSVTSEHDLDDYPTDILLVKDVDDFQLAVKRFGQYKDYIMTGII